MMPANEMVETTETAPSGYTFHYNRIAQPSSYNRRFRTRAIFLCEECAEIRSSTFRSGLWKLLVLSLVLVVIIIRFDSWRETRRGAATIRERQSEILDRSAASTNANATPMRSMAPDDAQEDEPVADTIPDESMIQQSDTSIETRLIAYVEEYLLPEALSVDRSQQWGPYDWDPEHRTGMVEIVPAVSPEGRICREFAINFNTDGLTQSVKTGTVCKTLSDPIWQRL